jgi:hypothetical protein
VAHRRGTREREPLGSGRGGRAQRLGEVHAPGRLRAPVRTPEYHVEWRMSLKTGTLRVVILHTARATGTPAGDGNNRTRRQLGRLRTKIGVPVVAVGVWSPGIPGVHAT